MGIGKDVSKALGGIASGGLKGIGSLGLMGDAAVKHLSGGSKDGRKQKSTMDRALSEESARHKEGHKQRSEHGKY